MAGTGLQGAYALQSLDDLLRQRILDRREAEKVKEQIRQFNVRSGETARSHDLQAQMRQDTLAASAQAREDARTQNFAQTATPMPDVGEQMAGSLRSIGLGGMLRTGPASVTGGQTTGLETFPPAETPAPTFQRGAEALPTGGFRYQEARQKATETATAAAQRDQERQDRDQQAREFRAAQDAQYRTTAAQGAAHQRAMETIAGGNAQTNRMLAESTLETRQAATQAKADKVKQAEDIQRQMGEEGLRTVDALLDPQGQLTSGAKARLGYSGKIPAGVQSLLPGVDSREAEAAFTQLVSRQSLKALQDLRRSSPTGGALGNVSDHDMKVLETAATILGQRNLPEGVAQRELQHVRDVFQKAAGLGQDQAAPSVSSSASQTDPLGIR